MKKFFQRIRHGGRSLSTSSVHPASNGTAPHNLRSPLLDPMALSTLVPHAFDEEKRVQMTLRCRDADSIPKVPDAGTVKFEAGERVQIMHNGVKVVADGYYGAWMTRLIELSRGHHETQEEVLFDAVVKTLPPGGTMLELGGFWAFYSIWFLSADQKRRAIIAEPDPEHLAVGRKNLSLNGLKAELVQGYVGSTPGVVTPFQTEESGILDVMCLDLPALLKANNIETLTIFHCDAQGAELAALTQMEEYFLSGKVKWVFVSTHHHRISGDPITHERCVMKLRQLGATIIAEHDVYESYSGDGLICAVFGELPKGWVTPKMSYNRASESLFRHPSYDLAQAQGK